MTKGIPSFILCDLNTYRHYPGCTLHVSTIFSSVSYHYIFFFIIISPVSSFLFSSNIHVFYIYFLSILSFSVLSLHFAYSSTRKCFFYLFIFLLIISQLYSLCKFSTPYTCFKLLSQILYYFLYCFLHFVSLSTHSACLYQIRISFLSPPTSHQHPRCSHPYTYTCIIICFFHSSLLVLINLHSQSAPNIFLPSFLSLFSPCFFLIKDLISETSKTLFPFSFSFQA